MTTWTSGTAAPALGGTGRYRLDLLLDRSTLAETWQGWDLLDRQAVTVRVVPLESKLLRERWTELGDGWRQALFGLRHPAVVRVLDLVADGTSLLLVSELHAGATSLSDLGLGPRPEGEVAALLAPVADALAYAHRVGLPHLAVSPRWVLVGRDGEVWLDACGLAPLADAAGLRPTVEGGTALDDDAPYRAPEQAGDDPGGPPADLFALGRIVCAMTDGPGGPAARAGAVRELGEALTAADPAQRPSAREAADRLTSLADPPAPPRPLARGPAFPSLDEVAPRPPSSRTRLPSPSPAQRGPRRRPQPPLRPPLQPPPLQKPPPQPGPQPRSRPQSAGSSMARQRRIGRLTTHVGAALAVAGAVALALVLLDDGAATPIDTPMGSPTTAAATTAAVTTAEGETTDAVPTATDTAAATGTDAEAAPVVPLLPGPSTVCPFAVPRGWRVVFVDRPIGRRLRTAVRAAAGTGLLYCDAAVPSGPEARATAAAARASRGSLQAFTDIRFGPRDGNAGGAWVWEYSHRLNGSRVRVLRTFLNGGDALGLAAAETEFEALRPTYGAIVVRYERGG